MGTTNSHIDNLARSFVISLRFHNLQLPLERPKRRNVIDFRAGLRRQYQLIVHSKSQFHRRRLLNVKYVFVRGVFKIDNFHPVNSSIISNVKQMFSSP